MDNTIIQQGMFTSTGASVRISLRSDVDWMAVYNLTQAAANQVAALGVKYYWQRGMATGGKWTTFKSNAANAANLEQYAVTLGFTLLDSSVQTPGVLQATITAVSNANPPVVSAIAHGLAAGDVVRLINITGAQQLGGFDFTVGYNTLTANTFDLSYMTPIVAGTAGSFRKINFNPIFYPRRRFITSITQAAQAVVVTSVKHGYTIGQKVRMVVPAAYGMVEMNGLQATIVDIDDAVGVNSFTIDIDSTAFTAFAFPLTAAVPFTPAEVVPMGEDTAEALLTLNDILIDATENTSFIGMKLQGGANCPAGANGDVMMWVAGKSFNVDNNGLLLV